MIVLSLRESDEIHEMIMNTNSSLLNDTTNLLKKSTTPMLKNGLTFKCFCKSHKTKTPSMKHL